MHPLSQLAQDLTRKHIKCSMEIGKQIKHPDDRIVKVKSGYFLDFVYGRLSNWWTWNEVLPSGLGPDESGYGW